MVPYLHPDGREILSLVDKPRVPEAVRDIVRHSSEPGWSRLSDGQPPVLMLPIGLYLPPKPPQGGKTLDR